MVAVGVLAAIIAAVCMVVRLVWIEPLPALVQPWGWMALPFAALFGLGVAVVPALLWYPVSCLIVSGIKSRWVRVAVYTLMFWAPYSAIILMMGTQRFML